MIKILIADDHPIFRKGLRQIISETSDMSIQEEVDNGLDLLKRLRQGAADVVLLDITMPGQNGIEVLAQIKKEMPKVHVLVLSMHPEEQFALRALRGGAAGYLTKESAPAELITAIRKIAEGGRYVSPSLAEYLAYQIDRTHETLPHESLSDREYEVLCLISSGRTISEIASELSISVKTASTYRSRLLEKMGMKNNAELTRYAIINHLID